MVSSVSSRLPTTNTQIAPPSDAARASILENPRAYLKSIRAKELVTKLLQTTTEAGTELQLVSAPFAPIIFRSVYDHRRNLPLRRFIAFTGDCERIHKFLVDENVFSAV